MAATLTDIREGLAANLAVLEGIFVSAYMLANPTPPCIFVSGPGDYDLAMGTRSGQWHLGAGVRGAVDGHRRADEARRVRGPVDRGESVKAALEADGTLGGIVADTTVVSCTRLPRAMRAKRHKSVLGANGTSTYSHERREDGNSHHAGCDAGWNRHHACDCSRWR
jgi:hypothetical protein